MNSRELNIKKCLKRNFLIRRFCKIIENKIINLILILVINDYKSENDKKLMKFHIFIIIEKDNKINYK